MVLTTRAWIAANQGTLQQSLHSRNVGLAGRATYSDDKRYFLEYNFGYNGSERFAKNHRWGFFHSAGIEWLISYEKLWVNLSSTIHNIKLRYPYVLFDNDHLKYIYDLYYILL